MTDGLEIPIRIPADVAGAQQAAQALDKVASATTKAAAAAKTLTAAHIDQLAEESSLKEMQGLMDAGLAKNAESTAKLTLKKKSLVASLDALKRALGNIPGLWQAMVIAKNPVTAAVVAVAMAVGYVAKQIAAANAAARDIKSLDDFVERMESIGTASQRASRERSAFEESLKRIGTEAQTSGTKFRTLTDQLALQQRLQDELSDKTLAADLAEIEASDLDPAAKSKAKARRQSQFESDKEARTRTAADQLANQRAWAIAQSQREADDAAQAAGSLRGGVVVTGRAKDEADQRLAAAKQKLDEDGKKLQDKITDLEMAQGYLQAGDFGSRENAGVLMLKHGLAGGSKALPGALTGARGDLEKLRAARDQAALRASQAGADANEAARRLQEQETRGRQAREDVTSLSREQQSAVSRENMRRSQQPAIQSQVERERAIGVDVAEKAERQRRLNELSRGVVGGAVVGGAAALAHGAGASEQEREAYAKLQQLLRGQNSFAQSVVKLLEQNANNGEVLAAVVRQIESKVQTTSNQMRSGFATNRGG